MSAKHGKGIESAWLGMEAIPGGLAQIRDAIEASARTLPPTRRFRHRSGSGLIAIAGRWIRKAARIS